MPENAKAELKRAKEHLVVRLRRHADKIHVATNEQERATIVDKVANIHGAIEAIDKTIAGRWSAAQTATLISTISATIAATALILNAFILHLNQQLFDRNQEFQRTSRRVDVAISWCTNFYLPSFVAFQSVARELKDLKSPYRLPNGANITQVPTLTLENVDAAMKTISQTTKTMPAVADIDLYESLLALLNYIDTGALMALKGDMDRERFEDCFRPFAKTYIDRYDHSYIGLRAALLNSQDRKEPIEVGKETFPFIACVFLSECNADKMKTN